MSNRPDDIWLGIGVKTGGFMIAAGLETVSGKIFNLANPSMKAGFGITSARIGLGLGGGGSLSALCVFNCRNIWQVRHQKLSGIDVNIAFGGKFSEVAKALKNYKFFTTLAKVGTKLRLNEEHLENFYQSMQVLKDSLKVKEGKPVVMMIDTPAGFAAEFSVNYKTGKIEIY